jgi:hypothetical protein
MVKVVSEGNEPMRVILHTLASGLIAKAQGGSATGGAAGGLVAGVMNSSDKLSQMFFGKSVSELSEDEKMLVVNIVTLAGAAAGGAVDGRVGVVSGASAGRTEVENNALSDGKKPSVNIYSINPMRPNVLDGDGDPLKAGGGGIAKTSIHKGQQKKHVPGTNEYKIASEAGLNKSIITVPA